MHADAGSSHELDASGKNDPPLMKAGYGPVVAMVLKGLPTQYNTFKTVVTQRKREMSFTEFKVTKVALRSFEETEKCQQPSASGVTDRVMTAQPTQRTRSNSSASRAAPTNPSVITCYACGKIGHKSYDCRSGKNTKRWCANCKSATHDTAYCRRKNDSVNQMIDTCDNMDKCDDNECHSFVFRVSVSDHVDVCSNVKTDCLLMDCGATAHIINDRSKFVNFDDEFDSDSHFIELADGSRTNGIVQGRGKAQVLIHDSKGGKRKVMLENALYVPSYKQDIFSVQAATCKGTPVSFTQNSAELRAPDGTTFDIEKQGRLYFLNNTVAGNNKTHTMHEWHKILGHCNVRDVCKLEGVVEGLKITDKGDLRCDVCVMGKCHNIGTGNQTSGRRVP